MTFQTVQKASGTCSSGLAPALVKCLVLSQRAEYGCRSDECKAALEAGRLR